jgi:2-oxo-4-hydroxy-4-carboxy-5-ureidoimidazoline decarboxylase
VTIADLNDMERDAFVEAIGWVFEHSPWVAERAWARRPFASFDRLHAAMVESMRAATPVEQLSLLRAHPDLGARMSMSETSVGEQASAGLDRLRPDDFQRLQQLNTDYRAKFAFPLLFAVKGSRPDQILEALQERLRRDVRTEFDEALRQVARIARFRLEGTLRCDDLKRGE